MSDYVPPVTAARITDSTTAGRAVVTLPNPSAISFLRVNADNTVSALSASATRTALGGTTIGTSLYTLANPGAITFPRLNADNTATALSATDTRTALEMQGSVAGAEFWDDFAANDGEIIGRASNSGHVWAETDTDTGVVEVAGGVMKLASGQSLETIYPYVVLARDIETIGAEFSWVNVNQANVNLTSPVLIVCADGTDLEEPFFHLTLRRDTCNLEWLPNGYSGGGNVSVTQAVYWTPGQVITVQAEIDRAAGTARFYGSGLALELKGLTIPTGLRTAMYEFAIDGTTSAKEAVNYHRVWANARNPSMLGVTTAPFGARLNEVAGGLIRVRPGIYQSLDGGVILQDYTGADVGGLQANFTTGNVELLMSKNGNGITFLSGFTGTGNGTAVASVTNGGGFKGSGLTIGGSNGVSGTTMAYLLWANFAADWPEVAALGEQTLTFNVPGAVTSTRCTVAIGINSALEAGLVVKQSWVSAADTVSITVANITALPINPASTFLSISVFRF